MGCLNRRQKNRLRRARIHRWIKYFLPLQTFEFKCSQCDLYYIVYNYYKCWAERFPGGHCPRCNSTRGELCHHEHNPSGLDILLSRPKEVPILPKFKNKKHAICKRRPREVRAPKHKPINLSQVTEFVFLCRHHGIFRILPGRKQYPKVNQQKPLVSIYGPSVRPELWDRLYESVMNTKIPFEIIFSGNAAVQPKMPSNFKYIYSTDTALGCTKLAAEKARGKYLLLAGDDFIFSRMAIDRLYNFSEKINNPRAAVTFDYGMFSYNTKSWKWNINYASMDIDANSLGASMDIDANSLGHINLIRRDTFFDIGGVNNKFHDIYFKWDSELLLRLCNSGGSIITCEPKVKCFEIHPFDDNRLCTDSIRNEGNSIIQEIYGNKENI